MAQFGEIDDPSVTPTPEIPAPGGTGPEGGAPIQQQETAIHPSWDKALAAVPESLRGPIYEQIRTSERESQSAIEKARENATPDEWRALVSEAAEVGLTPAELVDSYNATNGMRQQIAEDPDAFLSNLTEQVRAAVRAGDLTAKQGSALLQDAQDQVDDTVELDPRDAQIRELQERQERFEQGQMQQQEAAEYQQQLAEAEQTGQDFINQMNNQFEVNGMAGLEGKTKAIIAGYANDLLEENENLTAEAAATQAVAEFKQRFNIQTAPAPAAGQPRVPIGGGSNGVPVQGAPKFSTAQERDAAMVALAKQMVASDQ